MPERLGRRLTPVAVLAATGVGLDGCRTGDGEQGGPLRGLPREQQVGIVVRDADRAPTWHFGSFVVCLEERGPVAIEGIEAVTVGDVTVRSAGAKQATDDLAGAWPGPYSDAYVPADGFEVTERCGPDRGVELVLELQVPAEGSSALDGFTIRYSRGDRQYEVGYAAQIVLCRGTDTGADEGVLAVCAEDPTPQAPAERSP